MTPNRRTHTSTTSLKPCIRWVRREGEEGELGVEEWVSGGVGK